MKRPLYQIDAFTSRLFGGNPAAVVTLDQWLPDDVFQAIAAENNLAETAFVMPREQLAPLRWFTPTVEVDLCGHATLAAGHVLFAYHYPALNELSFTTRSGVLAVSREGGRLSLDFPARPARTSISCPVFLRRGRVSRRIRSPARRYRLAGKENVYAIGEYFNDKRVGHVSLDQARGERD